MNLKKLDSFLFLAAKYYAMETPNFYVEEHGGLMFSAHVGKASVVTVKVTEAYAPSFQDRSL